MSGEKAIEEVFQRSESIHRGLKTANEIETLAWWMLAFFPWTYLDQ